MGREDAYEASQNQSQSSSSSDRDQGAKITGKESSVRRRSTDDLDCPAASSLALNKTCSLSPVSHQQAIPGVKQNEEGGDSYVFRNGWTGMGSSFFGEAVEVVTPRPDCSEGRLSQFNTVPCANFYKLASSELNSSDEIAVGMAEEVDAEQAAVCASGSSPKGQLQQCANQRPIITEKLRKLVLKNCSETSAWTPPQLSGGLSARGGDGISQDAKANPQGLGWQSTKHTMKDRMEFICLNERLADVFFVLGGDGASPKERIPAHKFVLSIGSAVFDAMFKFGSGQAPDGGVQEIELVDVEPKALLALLTFLYTDEVSISPDSVMATLYTAKKYAVPALESLCVNFLKENLNSENAFMLLGQARLFDEQHLMELCLNIIDRDTNEAMLAEGFTDVDHDTLCCVLRRDSLRIDELPLFRALVRWSAEACKRKQMPVNVDNQRGELGDALRLIRYNQMTVQEFAEHVAMSKLLTDHELVNIFLHFTLNTPTPHPIPMEFPAAPRRRFIGKEMSINRFQRIEASWGYSGTPDRIKFTVDAPIFVLGFGLYGSMNDTAEYGVTIEIINFGSGQILAHHENSFISDGTPSIFRVMFKEPVEIVSGLTYIASARLKGAESHYGTKGLRRIVRQMAPAPSTTSTSSITDSAITFQFSYAAGNNNGTSVDDGQIPEIVFCQKF